MCNGGPLDMRLVNSSTMIVAGPTQAGKTTFVKQLLDQAHLVLKDSISKIYWICHERPLYDFNSKYIYIEGIPDDFSFIEANSVVVLDDLMNEARQSPTVTALFTKISHLKNVFIIYISQNFYNQGKEEITRRRNCQYIVLFKNPADANQIQVIGRMMFPEQPRLLPMVYKDVVNSHPHAYLMIDLRQETPDCLRVRSNVLLEQNFPMTVYKQR